MSTTRDILFRGKRTDNGKWVEGDLMHGVGHKNGRMYMHPIKVNITDSGYHHLDGYEVHPESIGQFTGLLDKNGKKIFEGDWLNVTPGYSSLVKFEHGAFVSVYSHPEDGETIPLIDLCLEKCEIVESTHDNPEPLVS